MYRKGPNREQNTGKRDVLVTASWIDPHLGYIICGACNNVTARLMLEQRTYAFYDEALAQFERKDL